MGRLASRLPRYNLIRPIIQGWLRFPDDVPCYFGTSDDAAFEWDTGQTTDALVLGLGGSNVFIICEKADMTTDFARADQINPRVFLHSADATDLTQYVSYYHDQTNGNFMSGTGLKFSTGANGDLNLAPGGTGKVQVETAYYMPTADGNANEVIKTDGSENLSWVAQTAATKEFFIPATYGTGTQGATGDFPVWNCNVDTAEIAYISFCVPTDCTTITDANVVIIAGGAATPVQMTYQIETDFGARTEAYNNHSTDTGAVVIGTVSTGEIAELAITTTNMAALDFVGVKITNQGTTIGGDVDFDVIGIRFKYT